MATAAAGGSWRATAADIRSVVSISVTSAVWTDGADATGAACDALSRNDPANSARRKTHREVAYAENGLLWRVPPRVLEEDKYSHGSAAVPT